MHFILVINIKNKNNKRLLCEQLLLTLFMWD